MIIWIGPYRTLSSYAESARRMLPAMSDVWVWPQDPPNVVLADVSETEHDWLTHHQVPSPEWIASSGAPVIYNTVPGMLSSNLPAGWINSGWDASPYPASWVKTLNTQKGYITWSHWTADIAKKSGVTVPIHVLPIPYTPRDLITTFPKPATTVFGMVGQLVPRKALLEMIETFWQTFTDQDDVALIVKGIDSATMTTAMVLRDLHYRKRTYSPPPTLLWTGSWSPADMAQFYNTIDVFIGPSRGEGFGMPYLEAAMHHTALMVVDQAGGYEDWLPAEGAWRIPSREVKIPAGGIPDWQEAGMTWWETRAKDWQAPLWEAAHHHDLTQTKATAAQVAATAYGSLTAFQQRWTQTVLPHVVASGA